MKNEEDSCGKERICDWVNRIGNAKEHGFDRKWDQVAQRVSFGYGFTDHFYEELSFIAGVLDMLFILSNNEHIGELHESTAFVLLDARERALNLSKLIQLPGRAAIEEMEKQ